MNELLDEESIKELLKNINNDENYNKLMKFINNKRTELRKEFEVLISKVRKKENNLNILRT